MNLNQLFESLSADQRRAGQLPANFQAPNTSPQLAGPYPGKNATRGYLVGEDVRDLGYDAQSLIMKLRRDVEEKRLQPTRQAVLSAARELADEMNVAPELLVRQVLGPGVAEAMKPSDVPPGMRQRLTMRDIEAERPQGAFRFRVTFPDGATADFMDFEAAQQRAAADRGRISKLSENQKKSNPRVQRILTQLRARHPQAEDDLEALIFDFRSQQRQDRSDITRLDAENDAEEADIERLEKMLNLIRQRRDAAAVAEDPDTEMQDFLARGGKIQQEPGRTPKLATRLRQQGSRHIGQGREPRAGQLSGRGANVNVRGGKPVVTAEGLQSGEYHVATVTLDDGTEKRVRITTDEDFRDSIHKHFARLGREVTDIDMDYAVRSDFAENKPTFTGVPVRASAQPRGPTRTLPPAPGRPGMVGGPSTAPTQRSVEQDLARRMAAEDVLGDAQRRLSDVLQQRQQRQAQRMLHRQAPQDVLGDPVRKIDLGDGNVLMIHGNEDDGFRIHLGQRMMPTRFASMEQAEMATRMYEAKRDACYHKVKAASKIWPSAYASGRLVQCRKKGAANYGNKSKK